MTAYFDRRAQALDEMERRWRGGDLSVLYPDYEAARDTTKWDPMRPHDGLGRSPLEVLEQVTVREVELVASLPGFPADLRDEVELVVAHHGSDPLACGTSFSVPDDQDAAATFRRLHYLVGDLHTVFHEVGRRAREAPEGDPLSWFSDNVDSCLTRRASSLFDRRLELLRQRPEWADRMRRFDEWEAAQREALAAG